MIRNLFISGLFLFTTGLISAQSADNHIDLEDPGYAKLSPEAQSALLRMSSVTCDCQEIHSVEVTEMSRVLIAMQSQAQDKKQLSQKLKDELQTASANLNPYIKCLSDNLSAADKALATNDVRVKLGEGKSDDEVRDIRNAITMYLMDQDCGFEQAFNYLLIGSYFNGLAAARQKSGKQ